MVVLAEVEVGSVTVICVAIGSSAILLTTDVGTTNDSANDQNVPLIGSCVIVALQSGYGTGPFDSASLNISALSPPPNNYLAFQLFLTRKAANADKMVGRKRMAIKIIAEVRPAREACLTTKESADTVASG